MRSYRASASTSRIRSPSRVRRGMARNMVGLIRGGRMWLGGLILMLIDTAFIKSEYVDYRGDLDGRTNLRADQF